MKNKILFLSPLPPPYYGSAMSSKECLDILKSSEGFEIKNIKINIAKDFENIGRISKNKFTSLINLGKEIESTVENFQPDLVYFMPATAKTGILKDYFLFRKLRKKYSGKIMFHIRARIENHHWKNPLYKKIYSEMFENQKIIFLDESFKNSLGNLVPEKNIFILPNAIKNELNEFEFKKIISKRKKRNSFNLLFLSNLDESKGWLKLLQACRLLSEKGINFKCSFVGNFPEKKQRNKFFNYIEKNNFEKEIFYLGKKIGKEKNKILGNSDVFVFPTEYKLETFGRVNLEAMMFGLPIIANSIAAIPNIISHKKTGFLLKNNSPEEIADYLEQLYKNKEKRIQMGIEARKIFLQKFEIKNYSNKFLKIIKSASSN